jgi:small subunit ribosomal protein S1
MSDSDDKPVPGSETPADPNKDVRLDRFLRKGRQRTNTGGVPSLEQEQTYGYGEQEDSFEADLERQMEEALAGFEGKDLLGEDEPQVSRGKGKGKGKEKAKELKKGRVFRVHGQDVFIDLPGSRSQGVLNSMQFPAGVPAIGTEVEVYVEGFDSSGGLYLLSLKGSAVEVDWSSVRIGMTVEARVTGVNKGGLSVEVNGIRGFLPISQIELFRVENAEEYVGKKLLCMVSEADPSERNLVVSRRGLLEKEREEQREKLWTTLAEGQIFEGIVRNVRDFGAFVDIGGVDGLLHVGDMSWTRVKDASEVVQPGQKVKVVVLKVDREKRKVSLGAKQLMTSPWDDIEERYVVGDVVSGKVGRLTDFGAFVELEPGIEGLIHISELSPNRVRRVADVVQLGSTVEVKVLSVDKVQRRIGLSLKAMIQPPEPVAEPEPEEEEAPAEPVKPRVRTTPLRGGTGSGGPLFKMPGEE